VATFYAATRIEYGAGDGEVIVFEPNEKVTGLDEKTMKVLWDNGALYTKEEDTTTSAAGTIPNEGAPIPAGQPGAATPPDKNNKQTSVPSTPKTPSK
jgi:hypothetical protein